MSGNAIAGAGVLWVGYICVKGEVICGAGGACGGVGLYSCPGRHMCCAGSGIYIGMRWGCGACGATVHVWGQAGGCGQGLT